MNLHLSAILRPTIVVHCCYVTGPFHQQWTFCAIVLLDSHGNEPHVPLPSTQLWMLRRVSVMVKADMNDMWNLKSAQSHIWEHQWMYGPCPRKLFGIAVMLSLFRFGSWFNHILTFLNIDGNYNADTPLKHHKM